MRRAGSTPGAFIESFWGGKVGKRGGFIPWYILCSFFPVLPGNLWVLRRFPALGKLRTPPESPG